MRQLMFYRHIVAAICFSLVLSGCGGSESDSDTKNTTDDSDVKYSYQDRGVPLFAKTLPATSYQLSALSDSDFNQLTESQKYVVADKLLASFYFGMPISELKALIDSGTFMSTIQQNVTERQNDVSAIEDRLTDTGEESGEFKFSTYPSGTFEVSKMLARFYLLDKLDKSYTEFWAAYVLTSNIMFSPASELPSSHAPNIDRVYNRLVRNLRDEVSAQYSTYIHMMSSDNWRRFRSAEDNGREMMEIYLLDFDDTKVPIAGKALRNWYLNRDNDTLVIGLNENTEPLSLFNTTIRNGFDFYSQLVLDSNFFSATTKRLVDVYFPTFSTQQKSSIISQIVASSPKTWQDILLQIVFSKSYLLESDKPRSAEEVFFSLSKKMHFQHGRGFFSYFARSLTEMNQAAMRYKLGKYREVPLDTQSFSNYHKFVREALLMRYKASWSSGWQVEQLLSNDIFNDIAATDRVGAVEALVNHVFLSTISRLPTEAEMSLFKGHMLTDEGEYVYPFRLIRSNDDLGERRNAALTILDYISRLTQTYRFQKVSS